jgi:hypothetical protein
MLLITITEWWAALGSPEQIYWGIALVATTIFSVQLVLTFTGLEMDLEADIDTGDGLGIISLRSLIAFSAFFGWGGIAALSSGFSPAKSFMVAFLAGFIAMIALAYMLAQIWKMQESGTIDVYDAIAKTGEVYLPIPEGKNGTGKIHIEIANKLMEFDAVTDQTALTTGTKVRVDDILRDNIMLVTAIT